MLYSLYEIGECLIRPSLRLCFSLSLIFDHSLHIYDQKQPTDIVASHCSKNKFQL